VTGVQIHADTVQTCCRRDHEHSSSTLGKLQEALLLHSHRSSATHVKKNKLGHSPASCLPARLSALGSPRFPAALRGGVRRGLSWRRRLLDERHGGLHLNVCGAQQSRTLQ